MDYTDKFISFAHKYAKRKFYQPVVFIPGIIEIRGKWHEATKNLANTILSNVRNKSVFDVGCDNGYFLFEAKKKGATNCIGIDKDVVSISISREIAGIQDLDISFMNIDIEEYEFTDKYDIILLLNVLHTVRDPLSIIKKCLDFTRERLVIEHDFLLEDLPGGFDFLSLYRSQTGLSPRCANQRYLTIIFPRPE